MRIRRCAALWLEPREETRFDLEVLLAGGTGVVSSMQWVAHAPQLDEPINVDVGDVLMLDDGVHRINFGFIANRWTNPFWQIWDLMMLWLAQLHGGNGLRTVIADYSRKDSTRFWLTTLLVISMILIMVVGTYTIFTFSTDVAV